MAPTARQISKQVKEIGQCWTEYQEGEQAISNLKDSRDLPRATQLQKIRDQGKHQSLIARDGLAMQRDLLEACQSRYGPLFLCISDPLGQFSRFLYLCSVGR